MLKLAELMESHKELLATIDAWDNGTYRSTLSQNNSPFLHSGGLHMPIPLVSFMHSSAMRDASH